MRKVTGYLITGLMLGKLKSAGCKCGSLPPNEVCEHCELIGRIKTECKSK